MAWLLQTVESNYYAGIQVKRPMSSTNGDNNVEIGVSISIQRCEIGSLESTELWCPVVSNRNELQGNESRTIVDQARH